MSKRKRQNGSRYRVGGKVSTVPLFSVFLLALLLVGCEKEEDPAVLGLLRFERETYRDQPPSERKIERLREEVDRYRNVVEERVQAAGQLGSCWKLLGIAYMEKEMYALAYESFLNALEIYPENPVLLYHAGLSAARLAAASADPKRGEGALADAERLYRLALRFDTGYADARYALAILYAFEMERPADARQLLLPLVERQPKRTEALFLLARTEAALGNVSASLDLYDRIIREASLPAYRKQAMLNRELLLGGAR